MIRTQWDRSVIKWIVFAVGFCLYYYGSGFGEILLLDFGL